MSATPEQRHATLALWLLLDQEGAPPAAMAVNWHLLLEIARQNTVLVRLTDKLRRAGLEPPAFFAAAAERERERAGVVFAVMHRLGERCERAGIGYLFPTAWQHFPDVSGDLDLLVLSGDWHVDTDILEGTAASLRARDLRDRLARTAIYWLPEFELALDVHHGRLGLVGEHAAYPTELIRRRQRHTHGAAEFFAPAPEDRLILQGMSRVAVRRSFSIADVAATVGIVRNHQLDWGFVVRVARHMGVLPGLCCYLSYVDQIYGELRKRRLLPPEARQAMTIHGWGSVAFRDGRYRFSTLRIRSRLYWRQLAAIAAAGEWRAAARACLMPAMVVACSLGLVGREPVEALESVVGATLGNP